jgi:aldehyde dehydrogenase (NAD+)
MVLKPSEVAPISGIIFAEVMQAANVPAGVFNLINGDGPSVGQVMAGHKDVDMVSFTGSTRAGIIVAKTAAETVKRVSQELGGKSPNIILPDADFEAAVYKGVQNCFGNSGQSCNAPTRMLVPADRHDEALKVAKKAAETHKVGDPKATDTVLGPVVSEIQYNKIQGLIEAGIKEGATLVTGGTGRPEGLNRGYYVRPTVFGNVKNDMTIAREEIFGPVAAVMPFDDLDDAVTKANATVYGLAAGVWTRDVGKAHRLARELQAGTVWVNTYNRYDSGSPFGGYKQSGYGRDLGWQAALDKYTQVKSVWVALD